MGVPFILLLLFVAIAPFSWGVTHDSRVDWTIAGVSGGIPNLETHIVNVKDVSVVGDGVTDDAAAIQATIDAATDPTVLFFPTGTYRIGS